jgi:hypothetical protein
MAQAQSVQAAPLNSASGFGKTERKDGWWVGPLVTALVLGTFAV